MSQTHSLETTPHSARTSPGPWRTGEQAAGHPSSTRPEEAAIPFRGHASVRESLRESLNRLRLLSSRLLTAHEDERKKAAKEIHEGLAQTLVAISLETSNVLSELDWGGGQAVKGSLTDVASMLQKALDDIRRVQGALWPVVLDDLGLLAAISSLCRQHQQTHPMTAVQPQIQAEETDVPESLKIVIYRVIEEALELISQSARATLVTISLRKSRGRIVVTINADDRKAWGSFDGFSGSLAISRLKHRVDVSAGVFSVSSNGAETMIEALWPLHEYGAN